MPLPNLILGCGYLGRRVAAAWLQNGRRVAALTRSRAAELAAAGIEPIPGDVLDPASLASLPHAGTVLYAVGMDRTAGRSMHEVYVRGLENVLQNLRCDGPFLYVSSTGVYGQTDGALVDETALTEPQEESGRIVLEAEQMLRRHRPDAMILRFAGIYGPDRVLRKQALLKGEPLVGDADKWLNLIHVDDGVAAVFAAESRGRPGEIYHVADGAPVRRRDFYTLLATLLGGPPAAFKPQESTTSEPSRRIGIRKATGELGFAPRFPSYVEGLSNAVRNV